ncbi:MAG: polysaccharide deacetylase family protein [Acetobacteraceae bacterium]
MPWKQGYTISDEISPRDRDLRWPDGRRCCVSITVDLSVASGADGITARDLASPRAQFGLRDGFAQVRAILRRFGLRATFAVPAVMARIHGATLRSLMAEGHEIAAEGLRHEDVSRLDADEERQRIALATGILSEVTGQRPSGWFSLPRQGDPFAGGTISPHTIDLLIEAGYAYLGNGLADDIPHYWVSDFASRRALLTLPYYYHYDDQFFLLFPTKGTGLEHADSLFRNWHAEFAAQYRRGRHFHMTLHPWAVGFAHRARLLEEFLLHLCGADGLWNPTGSELARYWVETCPQETHLRLEESVWRDHPGSLS